MGCETSGIGIAQFEQILNVMDVSCMDGKFYRQNHESLMKAFKKAAEESIKAAVKLEFELAKQRGDIKFGKGVTKVIADGSWLKRTYRSGKFDSNCGEALIIGYYTQKIIYFGVKMRDCFDCKKAKKLNKTIEHECFQSWDEEKSSGSMEAAIISEGFLSIKSKRS